MTHVLDQCGAAAPRASMLPHVEAELRVPAEARGPLPSRTARLTALAAMDERRFRRALWRTFGVRAVVCTAATATFFVALKLYGALGRLEEVSQ